MLRWAAVLAILAALYVLAIGVIVLGALLLAPACFLWWNSLGRITDLLAKRTTNQFTRGLASGFFIIAIPLPFIVVAIIMLPTVGYIAMAIDLVVWLALAGLWSAILFRGEPVKEWINWS